MLSPPKPLDEIQPNLVCEMLTRMECATAKKIWLQPQGPCGGAKGQISLKYNNKVNFKDFLYQTMCMFLQIHVRYIKHIEQDFCSNAWVMPQGWDLGVPGMPRGSKVYFFQTWSCSI